MAADYDGSIRIGVELDENGVTNELNKLTGEVEKSASSAGSIGDKLKTSMKVAGAAIAAATTAVSGFAASSVQVGASFDASMSQVAATLGLTTQDIKNNVSGAGDTFDMLREKALEMGSATKFTAQESAEGLNILAMSGYDAVESVGMIEDVLHLAAAGSMSLASSAGYVSGAMKGFADDTKDAAYYADLMAKGATLANTDVSQLGEALSGGAATAKAYGQSAETTALALLRLAEQGEIGSAASTALAAAMKNLYAPTDQAAKAMNELGVSAFDSTGVARDFNDVVNDLDSAMANLTDQERTQYGQIIFGIQGFDAYNKMVVTSTEKQKEWAAALEGATGEAARQYETMTDNLVGDIDKWNSALDGFKIALSDELTPTIREFAQFGAAALGELTAAFQENGLSGAMETLGTVLSEGLAMIIEQLPLMADAGMQLIGALGQGLIDNLPLLTSSALEIVQSLAQSIADALPELIPAATKAILEFGKALTEPETLNGLLEAATGIITGLVEGITAAIPLLIEYAPQIIANLVAGIIGAIPQLIEAGVQLILGLGEGLLKGLLSLPKIISEVVNGIVDAFKSLFGIHSPSTVFAEIGGFLIDGLLEGISNTWKSIVDFFTAKPKEIADLLAQAWEDIKTAAVNKWNEIKDSLGTAWDNIKDSASEKFGQIKTSVGEVWDEIKETASSKWEEIRSSLSNKWEDIKNTAVEKFDDIRSEVSNAWENIKTDIPKAWEDIKSSIKTKWDGIVEDAKGWGGDLCQKLANGIKAVSSRTAVTDAVKGLASNVRSYLHFSEPDVGPLSDFHTYMPDMMELMAEGIKNNESLALGALEDVTESMSDVLNKKSFEIPSIASFKLPDIVNGAAIPKNEKFTSALYGNNRSGDIDALAAAISQAVLSGLQGTSQNYGAEIVVPVTLELDGNVLTRVVVRRVNNMTRAAGKPVIDS